MGGGGGILVEPIALWVCCRKAAWRWRGGGSLRSDPSRRKRTGRRRDIIRKRSASAGVCVQSKHTHANGQQENLPKKKKIGEEKKTGREIQLTDDWDPSPEVETRRRRKSRSCLARAPGPQGLFFFFFFHSCASHAFCLSVCYYISPVKLRLLLYISVPIYTLNLLLLRHRPAV